MKAMALVLAMLWPGVAAAEVLRIEVDLSDQAMTVRRDGEEIHAWPVSTAREGKCTPVGEYVPYLMKRVHYSTLYDWAPMPWSIFFSGNYAIHGTTAVEALGAPASAGCIRLAPENAEVLFGEVAEVGLAETLVVIRE